MTGSKALSLIVYIYIYIYIYISVNKVPFLSIYLITNVISRILKKYKGVI